ncbi:S8 family peptidase [Candidatus Nitrosocosmicus arcticus]|uniref:Subtilisin-like serine protease n=1 Tax=Candidatus Nitrosocosmicus arcticus TaxID=2035267 RepID=A0A557SS89_9ARCH|nr:S8 family serine peptidase [Candidatus Nitrosocosmicus arcticus]TVP39483.1 Subtilisin-like serine protease [Candidatus Nitrosocosmicus arcticus]
MFNRIFLVALFFILFFSLINTFHFYPFLPFKAIGDLEVSLAFGATRNSETEVDEGDNSNSSTGSSPEIIRETEVDEGDNSNSSTGSSPEIISPIADAGTDITVQNNVLIQLDGSKSYDPNNYGDDSVRPSLNFDWTQTGGPDVILNNPTSANPTFTSPQVEEETRLTFQLVVSSDTATSEPDSVAVTVTPPTVILKPIADAGTDITVQNNVLIQLDGSKSYDPNNYGDDSVRPSLNFDWTQTGGPDVILNNPTSANPTFTSPQVEEETRLTFQLVVSSDTATSEPDSVAVTVTPPTVILKPIADAGTDITVQNNVLIQLDGSKSYDPNNYGDDSVRPSLNFDWTQTGGPDVILNNPTSANPTFTSPQVEEETRLTFQLVVSSDTATSEPDSVAVTVTPDTPPETPDTPPETPDTQEFQTIVKNCGTDPTEIFTGGSLTIVTDQDFSQVFKITPNPYTSKNSLYFVNNDFFDCDSNKSVISLNGLNYSWYTVEILDQYNANNTKTFDISINENFSFPQIYVFDRAFVPNLIYEPIRSQFIIWLNESVTTNAALTSQDYVQNGEIKFVFKNPPGFVINMNNSGQLNERDFMNKLSKDPRIFAINQDLNGKIASFKYNNQTVPDSLERINANVLNITSEILRGASPNQSSSLDFSNVDIAILDTGISLDHPDLNVYKNVSFIEGTLTGDDDLGHGSHIAGIAAAKDNSIGILGVAPGAKLWAIKICDVNGNCPLSSQIKGIQYVNEHADEIDIVNLSIENPPSNKLDKAINESLSKGLIYVVAAGNSNINTSLTSPARIPGVIAVSAISDSDGECGGRGNDTIGGPDDYAATFSNYGNSIDFAAPGVNVFSTYKGDGYAFDSGTSMASPVVAGQAALYKSFKPNATSAEVISTLLNSSIPFTTPCAGVNHGHFQDAQNYHKEPLIYRLSIPEVGVITNPYQ